MKILIINSVCGIRSTGRICADIAEAYEKEGHEVKIAYGRFDVPEKYKKYAVRIGNKFSPYISALKSRLLDNDGLNCKWETKKFLKWAEEFNPDLVWLHNIHDHYINYPLLFKWIKSRPQMQVKWTLHDCWAFTGHCVYFSFCRCEKWKSCCNHCPQKRTPPVSLFLDRSKRNYVLKKRCFTGISNLNIICVSNWLDNLVKQSFLSIYHSEVVYNKIDKESFKPTNSDFKRKYNLENKKIVLGVAAVWNARKGLQDFVELSKLLPNDYVIVLVGLNKNQCKKYKKMFLCIEKTNSKKELATIYTAADVFLNPSKEETFGLTTVEASSCGTIPIVLKGTACEELASRCGAVVINDSIDEMLTAITQICFQMDS